MDLLGDDNRMLDVGGRLRELRHERGMSMRALARASGLSTNALSMIERGRTSPSVSTLYKISEALRLPITAFFRIEPPKHEVVFRKSNEHKRIIFPRGQWEGLGGEVFIGGMEPFLLTLDPGANSGRFPMIHSGHEFVMCLSGEIEYEVEEERFDLQPGDTLLFAAQLSHRWRNPGKLPAKAIITLACFQKDEHPFEHHLKAGNSGEEMVPDKDETEQAQA